MIAPSVVGWGVYSELGANTTTLHNIRNTCTAMWQARRRGVCTFGAASPNTSARSATARYSTWWEMSVACVCVRREGGQAVGAHTFGGIAGTGTTHYEDANNMCKGWVDVCAGNATTLVSTWLQTSVNGAVAIVGVQKAAAT